MAKEKFDNIIRESPKAIRKFVRYHWKSNPKEAMHLVGEPSTVKSTFVLWEARDIASDEGREFLEWNRAGYAAKCDALEHPGKYFVFADLRAAETDVGEQRLQDMQNGKPYITYKYNMVFEVMSKAEAQGILFLDELNNAPNMTKMQFYKLINDRAIGDLPLSDGILVISAGNETEHAVGVTEDPVPLVLRRANYFIRPPTAEEFVDYAVQAGLHQWITGYVALAPQDVHNVKYDLVNPVGQPCSRTWTKLSNVLNANESMQMGKLGTEDAGIRAVSYAYLGAVGEKFCAYVETAKKVNIDQIIANPKLVKELKDELSLLYAVTTGVIEKYRTGTGKRKDEVIDAALEISLLIREEMGVFMMRQVKSLDASTWSKKVVSHPKFKSEFTKKYSKYFFATD